MNRFYSKIAICVIPVLLAGAVVAFAYDRWHKGEGGFKLGVDLAGGTDLIYEIDLSKFPNGQLPQNYNPADLASSLKRRIDPADLYNVTIRPVSNTRVEIILPTGGAHQAETEEASWRDFLAQVATQWAPTSYKVAPGRTIELIARINAQYPDENVSKIEQFVKDQYKDAKSPDAWNKLLAEATKQWPPRGYEVGRGQLQVLVTQILDQHPELSAQTIGQFVNDNYKVSKERRHVTTEEVQHIKELIAHVGSLEFRILANNTDDKEAIDAAKKYFVDAHTDVTKKEELERLALAGQPPPPPTNANNGLEFPTGTDIGDYSYSWVELGIKERHQLGLSNNRERDASPMSLWRQAADAREKGETVDLPPQFGGGLLYSRKFVNLRRGDKDRDKKYEYFILTRDSQKGKEITGKDLVTAFPENVNLKLAVGFKFNDHGGELFRELTTKNKPTGTGETAFKRHLAIVLDGLIESAPSLNAIISTDGVIEGTFTKEEVDDLVRVFRAGALPASLKPQPVSENTMGPTLGRETIRWGTISVGIAFAAILGFMLVYYRFAGMVACIALLANLLLTVAFMAIVNATFTLPGLAGLVLMLGMAVDANVLIYERLREERDRGASLALAIRNGYDRAFPTIIDTHLSSIFTAIVLYAVGNDQLKGFGISLTVGLIISLFTSLYMTRLMFDIWLYKGWLKKLSMFRLLSRPSWDFMGIRYYWFTATIILTVLGAGVFIWRLDKGELNIDFLGGTAYTGELTKPLGADEIRKDLEGTSLPDLSVEQLYVPGYTEGDKSRLFTIRTANQNAEEVQAAVNDALGDRLKRIVLKSYQIDPDNKRVTMAFADPATQRPDYASRGQVGTIMTREFNTRGLTTAAQQFVLEGLGSEKEGRFQWMELQLVQPLDRNTLEQVVKATQAEYAARPQPERLENFDSQLAAETQGRARVAILASWAAILLYLWFRFGNWTFGLAAVLCLIHDLFFTLGVIAVSHYIYYGWPGFAHLFRLEDFRFDLASVAALLTLVGYSVNDTIVVFDRIREVRGKNPLLTPQMINDSVNQTLSRTILTAFSVWLVVMVLYIWGGEGVHLFSFVMVAGVIVGTYSSIYIASPLLLIFGEGTPKAGPRERQLEAKREEAVR
jgi:SecD/SecF fusion protein